MYIIYAWPGLFLTIYQFQELGAAAVRLSETLVFLSFAHYALAYLSVYHRVSIYYGRCYFLWHFLLGGIIFDLVL